MQFFVSILALALVFGWVGMSFRRKTAGDAASVALKEGWTALAAGRQRSAQEVCEEASEALRAHVALLAGEGETLHLVGSAPRRPDFQLLDKVAAEWALRHCIPTGRGTGVMAGSDWRFEPVLAKGLRCGLLAIAGRGAREPVPPGQDWVLEDALRAAGRSLARVEAQALHTAPAELVVS